ncbi:P-loop NTPase [Sinorhizobium meliloti]|nr:P-loop NTPase [Sinorhizobium meliloti]
MPPGTGDAQLTMAQQVPLAGAVIVSTPQDLALVDARKGLAMFRKVEVPVLGIVENMSYFVAPDTGRRYDIFGHGGARKEAERIGVPFLGEVPLTMGIRETSDAGTPLVASEPDGEVARVYRDIAARVWGEVTAARQDKKPCDAEHRLRIALRRSHLRGATETSDREAPDPRRPLILRRGCVISLGSHRQGKASHCHRRRLWSPDSRQAASNG